jgi:hypothetical protein
LVESRPVELATRLDSLARDVACRLPTALLAHADAPVPTRTDLDAAHFGIERLRGQQIATQEELDWRCYRLYGLLPADGDVSTYERPVPPEVALGERAFEIVLARRIAAGTEASTWFERHGSTPITEIPARWPEDYRQVVQRRIDLIGCDRNIGLIERPEYKRRWNTPSWQSLEKAALRAWLLARLESPLLWPTSADQPPQITTTSRLADAVQRDTAFMQIAELYAGHTDFNAAQVVADLVATESVPFLPVLRYAETGLRKRAQWERTWDMQRHDDAIDAEVDQISDVRRRELLAIVKQTAADAEPDMHALEAMGKIPVPPKYQSKDFLKIRRLAPARRPGRAQGALGQLPRLRTRRRRQPGHRLGRLGPSAASHGLGHVLHRHEGARRLEPVSVCSLCLPGLLDLIPWLKQWHNEIKPRFRGAHGRLLRELREATKRGRCNSR